MEDHRDRDIDRVKEKLWESVYHLVGSGTIQARLHDVMLEMISIVEHQIPEEIVDDFAFVKHTLTKNGRRLSDHEGTELARKVLSMYVKLKGGI